MPFDDDYKKPDVNGLKKVSSKKSMFDDLPKKPSYQEFEQTANEANDKINNYKNEMLKLATKFKSIMSDKTLLANKSVLTKNIEKECFQKLIQIAEDINNDENEPQCNGSNSLIALILNTLLLSKDRMNYLEFHLSETINKVSSLDNKIKDLESKLLLLTEQKK